MTVLALMASLLWGTADFFAGTASRRVSALALTGAAHGVGLAGLLVWAVLDGGFGAWRSWLPLALFGGVFGYLGLGAFYRALARGPMGVVAPLAASGSALPVLWDLARGHVPATVRLVGLALAVAGCILASGPQLRGDRAAPAVIGLAAVSACTYGVMMVILAHGSEKYPAQTLTGYRISSVVLAAGLALAYRSAGGLTVRDAPTVVFVGAADTLANAGYALASRLGQIGVAAVLASLFPVVTALMARALLGERLRRVQTVGVVGALTGVVLIAAG